LTDGQTLHDSIDRAYASHRAVIIISVIIMVKCEPAMTSPVTSLHCIEVLLLAEERRCDVVATAIDIKQLLQPGKEEAI